MSEASNTVESPVVEQGQNIPEAYIVDVPEGRDLSFLTKLPGANYSPEELAELELYSKTAKPVASPASQSGTESQTDKGAEAQAGDGKGGSTQTSANTDPEVEVPGVFKNILEGTLDAGAKKPADIKEAITAFKTKYEIDIESVDGIEALQQKYEELNSRASLSDKAQQDLDRYKKHLQGLPEPVKAALLAVERGEDYNTAYEMATGKIIDFGKPFEKHDTYKLVKQLIPNLKLSQEDFEDDPNDERVVDAIELAKEKYAIKQRELALAKDAQDKKQQDAIATFQRSIQDSLDKAAKVFGGADIPEIKSISNIINEGKFDELFFTENGLRDDAVVKLIYAEHAPKMIEGQQKIISNLRASVQDLSNQLAELSGKSPVKPGDAGKGGGEGLEHRVDEPNNGSNPVLDSYNKHLESRRKTTY